VDKLNAFTGIEKETEGEQKHKATPKQFNEIIDEIRELYSYDLFFNASSKDQTDREQVRQWIEQTSNLVDRIWFEHQERLSREWADPERSEIGIPEASIPVTDLESLLLALRFQLWAVDNNNLRSSAITTFNRKAGKSPAWYTRPLIEMTRKLRKRHRQYTVEEIFYLLPDQCVEPPIYTIERNGLDELTIMSESGKEKNLTLGSFQKFCSKHKLWIGKRTLL